MKKHRLNAPIKSTLKHSTIAGLIILFIIIFFGLMFIIGYICKGLKTSDYFKIKDIVCRQGDIVELSYLKGKNIFDVDLRNESRYILEFYPDSRSVRLARLLPNRIFVDFVKRKPLAFVKLYRYFTVDEEGVLFYAPVQPQDLELPIIQGLETKIFGPKPGKSYNIRELKLALDIIKEIKSNRVLKKYKIKKIDVTNPMSVSIVILEQNLEIKLSQDNIKNKVIILAGLFTQEKNNLNNIKYIDLRFNEPVIKLVKPQLSERQ